MGRRRQAPHRKVVELGAAGHPRAVLGEQLAPGPSQHPAQPGRATTAPPLVTTPETRRWPGRPSRSQPTARLSRESACQAVGHWLHHSLPQLRTTRPIGYPIRWFAVLGGRVAHGVGGVRVATQPLPPHPSVESMASLSLARVASLPAGQADGHHPKQVVSDRPFQAGRVRVPQARAGQEATVDLTPVDTPQQPGGALRPVRRILHDQNLAPAWRLTRPG